MKLCYIYFEKIHYNNAKELFEKFDHTLVDLASNSIDTECDIYLLDIAHYTKDITLKLHRSFKEKPSILVYMFSSQANNVNFYQLAYMIQAKGIINIKEDVQKLILTIKKAFSMQLLETKSFYVGKFVASTLAYMIFKGDKLNYVSETLLKRFECSSLDEVEKKVCAKLPLQKLLSHDSVVVEIKKIFDQEEVDIIKSIYRNGEYLFILENYEASRLELCSNIDVATRLKFIDILKDRLEHKTPNDQYSVITIKIMNYKKISNVIGKSQFEEFISTFIDRTKQLLTSYIVISEYNQDFFVILYRNIPFETLVQKAEEFYEKMEEFIGSLQFKIDFALHVMQLHSKELGLTLSHLDALRHHSLSKRELQNKKIRYIGKYNENMSTKEIIFQIFENAFINDETLEATTIYKGVLLKGDVTIIKKEQNAVYIRVEKVLATAMNIAKIVHLRSCSYPQEVSAKVAFVDRKHLLSRLEHFEIVRNKPLEFEPGRVMFAKKSMAILALVGTKISAEIISISTHTIHLKVNKIKIFNELLHKKITISFTLPIKEQKIEEEVEIIYMQDMPKEQKPTLLVICAFDERSKNQPLLQQFVKTREEEIIEELKTIHF